MRFGTGVPHGVSEVEAAGEETLAARGAAILRVLLLAAVFVINDTRSHPLVGTLYFDIVLAAAATHSLLALARTWRPGAHRGDRSLVDVFFISALAFCSGASFPEIRAAFIVAPFMAAFRLEPRRTAGFSVMTAVLYIVIALTHPALGHTRVSSVFAHSLFNLWAGVAATVISTLRVRRERRIVALSKARGRLVAQTIEAEERVRKQISCALHDNVIQDLLAARQDLMDADGGDCADFRRAAHTIDLVLCQLRGTIEELDPYLLDHLELPAALKAIADRAGRHGDCRIEVRVGPEVTGEHAELVSSLARELLTNAAKHAEAAHVAITLRGDGSALVLEIDDDGRGFTDDEAQAALRAGHIGLAASRERVEAVGGRFELSSAPGAGTRIRCLLPLAADVADDPMFGAEVRSRPPVRALTALL